MPDSIIRMRNLNPVVTIAVPCYNTEQYLPTCLDSLAEVGEDIEVVAVNDGSTDNTGDILDDYAQRYPSIIRVFHQENGGWGEAINSAIRQARGTYFLVLDSDDHLDADVLRRVITKLRDLEAQGGIDLLVTNYCYDHVADHTTHTIAYRKFMPRDTVFGWDDTNKPGMDEYFMIHAMTFRTAILRESKLELPKHACYMDSLFALHPLPYVKKMYYLDADLYYYLIGREGQSIEIDVLKKNIGQQLLATRLVIEDFNYEQLCSISVKLADNVARYLSTMMTVSTIYLFKINTEKAIADVDEIWAFLKKSDPQMYHKVIWSMAGWAYRRTAPGRAGARGAYTLIKRVFKFA